MAASSRKSSRTSQKRRSSAKRSDSSWLHESGMRDIFGVVISAVGLALFVSVVTVNTGFVARALGSYLGLAFGLGRYAFGLILLAWGLSFFTPRTNIDQRRVGLGLAVILLSFIATCALFTPQRLYLDASFVSHYGGYVGGALSWALVSLLGVVISSILMVALFLVGLIICGLSFSAITARLAALLTRRRLEKKQVADPGDLHDDRTLPRAKNNDRTLHAAEPAEDRAAQGRRRERGTEKTQILDPAANVKTQVLARPAKSSDLKLPDLSLLRLSPKQSAGTSRETNAELEQTATTIVDTLQTFGVPARVVDWICGPTVTLFKVDIAKGIRTNRITALQDDLALALAASTIRIMAPIPGESLIGIEVPNERRSSVTLRDVLSQAPPAAAPLTLAIGKDVSGDPILKDLAKMPHVLIGGTTGSGKSVAINAMLMSILMRATPDEVRLVLVDPKRVELSTYNGIPHLYVPVVTDPKEAASALAWAVTEMERRLKNLQKAGSRNINEYYQFLAKAQATEDRPDWAGDMPLLVIVIDELADLMMAAGKEVEQSIVRLAQLGRAGGIHLIVATQRPDANIVTPLIKANITNRIAFNVPSAIDSRVILGTSGAETLTGLGDMLFQIPEWPKPKRIQGCFVSEDEVVAVTDMIKHQAEPDYHEEILKTVVGASGAEREEGLEADDPLLWEAAQMVVSVGMGSTSSIQRRFRVGYSRAGRIMDMLEQRGIVGPPDGSKPREVLLSPQELDEMMGGDIAAAPEGFDSDEEDA